MIALDYCVISTGWTLETCLLVAMSGPGTKLSIVQQMLSQHDVNI